VIYIELLVFRPPPIFQENNESFRKERNIEREILEALQRANIMGGLEKTL
jgi:hypothetical protein